MAGAELVGRKRSEPGLETVNVAPFCGRDTCWPKANLGDQKGAEPPFLAVRTC